MAGENKSNVTMDKSDKHFLSQAIKVNVNGDKSCTLDMMPCITDVM